MAPRLLFFLGLSGYFCAQTVQSARDDFATMDLVLLGVLVGVVLALQCALALLARRAADAVLAVFAIVNMTSLYAILVPSFHRGDLPTYGVLLAGAFAVLFTLLRMMGELRLFAVILPALAWLALLYRVAVPVAADAAMAAGPERGLPAGMRQVAFAERPNVYFISFDAMVPERITAQYMDLPGTAYHAVLDARFTRFRNFFAQGGMTDLAPTRRSLNMLLALDEHEFRRAARDGRQFGYYPGLEASPLLRLFKDNGYETTTYHYSRYLGSHAGPHVDRYVHSTTYSVCEIVDPSMRAWTFFGYCLLQDRPWLRLVLDALGLPARVDPTALMLAHVRAARARGKPQFVLGYIYSPGHTSRWYDHADPAARAAYRAQFVAASEATAAALLRLVEDIERNDPTAILFVFGDHGAYLSRSGKETDDRRFLVRDRIAVAGGIFPRGRCAPFHGEAYEGRYSTVNLAAIMILNCLADGKNAFITRPAYRILNEALDGPGEDFGDFVYE